jgi:hypothetical protein
MEAYGLVNYNFLSKKIDPDPQLENILDLDPH